MLKIYQRYAPDAVAPTTAYPLGSIKNDSVPGADDGTPLEKDWGNNVEGFHQALMTSAGLTASGTPDTAISSQLLAAVKIVAAKMVYPVGSYYINDSDTTNPATLFGFGTWVRVDARVLMGSDGTGTGAFGTPGAQGGALTHTHTAQGTSLTAAQLPAHSHGMKVNGSSGSNFTTISAGDVTSYDLIVQTESAGEGHSHTHTINQSSSLPPYRVVNMWRRTA